MSQTTDQPTWPDDEQLKALGRVIQAASLFEDSLRGAFCSLIGSKYAAVIAGSEQASNLIEKCTWLAKARMEIRDDQKNGILSALSKCKDANGKRNRFVHDVWAFGPNAVTHLMRRQRLGYQITAQAITTEEIDQLAGDLTSSSSELLNILFDALGPEQATVEAQLRWEQHLATITGPELYNLAVRRLAGVIGELSRLLEMYGENLLAKWASDLRDNVSENPSHAAAIIRTAYDKNRDITDVTLHGEPQNELSGWRAGLSANELLSSLNEQLLQGVSYIESLDIPQEDETGH
jgi:hypothetical protein